MWMCINIYWNSVRNFLFATADVETPTLSVHHGVCDATSTAWARMRPNLKCTKEKDIQPGSQTRRRDSFTDMVEKIILICQEETDEEKPEIFQKKPF